MDQRLAAGGLDLARDGFRLGAIVARIHDDRGTALRQGQRDGTADITACASDDSDFAG